MKKINILLAAVWFLSISVSVLAQEFTRKIIEIPKVDSGAVTIDGNMDEAVWQTAGQANLITAQSYEIWANKYLRENLTEPEYDELYGRMLWSQDTLYVFVHVDEFVLGDSINLHFEEWAGDQLFVGLSSRLGIDLEGDYSGNPYAAPEGPYHFFIRGEDVTLNNGDTTGVPLEWQRCEGDSQVVFNASDIARWAATIDTLTGIWNVEMAIYNPSVAAQSSLGFNIGGSTGSSQAAEAYGDAYGYFTWQPNVPDDPFADPNIPNLLDPGAYSLVTSQYWAMLKFLPGMDDFERKVVDVPMVDSGAVTIDGNMDEAVWQTAGQANLITGQSYEIWANKYLRENLTEPEYDELYGRMLWSQDTLYVFVHVDEFVLGDSINLHFNEWAGDQLFVGLSSRLGIDLEGDYSGNPYAAPEGPYHFFIRGEDVTLNNGDTTGVPLEWQRCEGDSQVVFNASDIARWAATIDTLTGIWNVEMAIYNLSVAAQSSLGFNIGGSTGSSQAAEAYGDAYGYFTWQPNVPDDPFADPDIPNLLDPGAYSLVTSQYWAILNFVASGATGVEVSSGGKGIPTKFALNQNYPNPFNPSTTIKFEIPKEGAVTLKVYNVVGELVETLINGQSMQPGVYSARWDAGNLASGIYFYRLEAGGVIATKKMMLLK